MISPLIPIFYVLIGWVVGGLLEEAPQMFSNDFLVISTHMFDVAQNKSTWFTLERYYLNYHYPQNEGNG